MSNCLIGTTVPKARDLAACFATRHSTSEEMTADNSGAQIGSRINICGLGLGAEDTVGGPRVTIERTERPSRDGNSCFERWTCLPVEAQEGNW